MTSTKRYGNLWIMLFLLAAVSPVVAQEFDNPILNPAAVYCDSLGYQYTIQTDATGDEGFCILPSGETVNSWQFFLGDIAHEYNYCGLKGYQTQTSTDPAITDRYLTNHVGVCVLPDTTTVEIAEFMKMRYDLKGWWEDRSTRPLFEPIDDTEIEEGTLLEIVLVATDPDNDPLSFTGYPLPAGATITDNTFSWRPAVGQAGTFEVTFTVNDGRLESFQHAKIVVKEHGQNNPPDLQNPGDQSALVGDPLSITLIAADPDNDPLTYTFNSIKELFGAIISGNRFTWTPNSGSAGTYSVTFKATDSGGLSDEETIELIVISPVKMDIKPGSCPNSFNRKETGVLPVAIVGTTELDVTDIDPTSISLNGVKAIKWELKDTATPYYGTETCGCHKLGGDGKKDLILYFKVKDITNVIPGTTKINDMMTLILDGELKTGISIKGQDCIKIVK